MGFKPSAEVKTWKGMSGALAANRAADKHNVDFHKTAAEAYKPHVTRVKAKLARIETAIAKQAAAAKSLPKLFKTLNAQAPKIDAQAARVEALEPQIAAKEKELKKDARNKTLKGELNALVAQHAGQVRVLRQMIAGFNATLTNFQNAGQAAHDSSLVAQDIQGM